MFFGGKQCLDVIELPNSAGLTVDVFSSFLLYLYSGELSLNHTNILYLLHLSSLYSVTGLQASCLDLLPTFVSKHTLLFLWSTSLRLRQESISKKCQELIFLRTRDVVESEDALKDASEEVILALVDSDTLNIGEMQLFRFVESWAQYHQSSSEFLAEAIGCIRFGLMKVEELEGLQGHNLVSEVVRLEALGHTLFSTGGGDLYNKNRKLRPRSVVV